MIGIKMYLVYLNSSKCTWAIILKQMEIAKIWKQYTAWQVLMNNCFFKLAFPTADESQQN